MSCKYLVQAVRDGQFVTLAAEPTLPEEGDVEGVSWVAREDGHDFLSAEAADRWAPLVGGSVLILGVPPTVRLGPDPEEARLAVVAERQEARRKEREDREREDAERGKFRGGE